MDIQRVNVVLERAILGLQEGEAEHLWEFTVPSPMDVARRTGMPLPVYKPPTPAKMHAKTGMPLPASGSQRPRSVKTAKVGGAPKRVKKPKRPTFNAARAEILDYLDKKGWDVKSNLKVPHATSPMGDVRLWFKSQAVYYTFNNSPRRRRVGSGHPMKAAMSLNMDIRDMSAEDFVRQAVVLAKKWG